MKLLQRLRDLRASSDELIENFALPAYDFAIEAGIDAYGIGATMEQDVVRFECLGSNEAYLNK